MTPDQIRAQLGPERRDRADPFTLLKNIAGSINAGDEVLGNELLLRALEAQSRERLFAGCEDMLASLTRAAGLYPYLSEDTLGVRDRLAYELHRATAEDEHVLHRVQAEVFHRLMAGERVILSAPTSFGKSRIIDSIVVTGKHDNIAIIVPTLALIDETRRRLSRLGGDYKLITHPSQPPGARNIFVMTPERLNSLASLPLVQFFVIDEFYKLDLQKDGDSDRVVQLNRAFYRLHKTGAQFYLLGPSISRIPPEATETLRCTFISTKFATVVTEQHVVSRHGPDDERLLALVRTLDEPTLIYVSSPNRANEIARLLVDAEINVSGHPDSVGLGEWVGKAYHEDWILARGPRHGIAIHHGRVPRSIGQYVVKLFNEEKLKFLVCTSTLIEGVNTKAKNVIIYDHKIARRSLDFFTFNNIRGRSGRMFQHFVGRVYLFAPPPQEDLPFVDLPFITQGHDVPTGLLLDIDADDRTENAEARVSSVLNQRVLPLSVVSDNSPYPPEAQIALAQQIQADLPRNVAMFQWTRYPKSTQLKYACELVWKHLSGGRARFSVFSGSQLSFKLQRLSRRASASQQVREELEAGSFAAKDADQAVERVLDFERNWAGFEAPRALRALSRIQDVVLSRAGHKPGSFFFYASEIEALFGSHVLLLLEEYGIPVHVAQRVPSLASAPTLDAALERLRTLDVSVIPSLSTFERSLLAHAKDGA